MPLRPPRAGAPSGLGRCRWPYGSDKAKRRLVSTCQLRSPVPEVDRLLLWAPQVGQQSSEGHRRTGKAHYIFDDTSSHAICATVPSSLLPSRGGGRGDTAALGRRKNEQVMNAKRRTGGVTPPFFVHTYMHYDMCVCVTCPCKYNVLPVVLLGVDSRLGP